MTIPGFAIGRMVHYVLPEGPSIGEHRPAVIVAIWNHETGACNLQVFVDGSNDAFPRMQGTLWATTALYDSENKAGHTWHFPEHVK